MSIENYSFFDAVQDGLGEYDRTYLSKDFASYFASFIGNGVYPKPSNSLQVLSLYDNMVLSATAGRAFVNGYFYDLTEDMDITVNQSHAAYNRKDIIVIQLNLTERLVRLVYKAGTASASPTVPTLQRDDDIYELKIAEIFVPAGAVKATQTNITDTRLDDSVCGLVSNVVETVDATSIFNQYQTYLNTNIAEWDAKELQQAQEWLTQMQQQQADYEAAMNPRTTAIDNWWNSIKNDIQVRDYFDFDNWVAFESVKYSTVFGASIVETLKNSVTSVVIANRTTTFNANGTITTVVNVYEDAVLIYSKTNTTTFNQNGSIESEVI